jgi:hypothetical protein
MTEVKADADERREMILQLLSAGDARPFSQALADLHRLRQLVHEEIARQFEGPLNDEISNVTDGGVLTDKADIARWVNAQLASLGLGIVYPGSSDPGHLTSDSNRFRIAKSHIAPRQSRTGSFARVPNLKLMPDIGPRGPEERKANQTAQER